MILTTTELVTAVRRKGQIPDGADYTDAEILAEADEVISGRLTEAVAGLSNGFFVTTMDVATVAGTARYSLPSRAVAEAIESARILATSGQERPLSHLRGSDASFSAGSSGTSFGYVIEGSDIILYPTPNTAETLRVRYMLRRSKLVPVDECVLITDVVPASYQVSGATKPSAFVADAVMDVVRPTAPFVTSLMGGTLFSATVPPAPYNFTFDSDVDVTSVAVGDYLCLAGETCVVHVPVELHGALANATASSILFQRGFDGTAANLDRLAQRDITAYQRLAAARAKDDPVKFINRSSMLRMRG